MLTFRTDIVIRALTPRNDPINSIVEEASGDKIT
jgi:hypothetical protein